MVYELFAENWGKRRKYLKMLRYIQGKANKILQNQSNYPPEKVARAEQAITNIRLVVAAHQDRLDALVGDEKSFIFWAGLTDYVSDFLLTIPKKHFSRISGHTTPTGIALSIPASTIANHRNLPLSVIGMIGSLMDSLSIEHYLAQQDDSDANILQTVLSMISSIHNLSKCYSSN